MKKYFLNQCLSVCMSIYVNTLNLNVSRSRHIEAGALFKRRSLDRGRARVVNFFSQQNVIHTKQTRTITRFTLRTFIANNLSLKF
jgi:hypothetical protein